MVTVTISEAQKLIHLGKYSLFVKFDYDTQILNTLKQFPVREFDGEYKDWEMPVTYLECVKKAFNNNVTIIGTLPEEPKCEIGNFEFKTKPYTHQLETMQYILSRDCCLVGDEMGLGKTRCAIDAAVWRKQHEGISHCLIICGVNGTKFNWLEEIHKHSNEGGWILGTKYTKSGKLVDAGSSEKMQDLVNIPPQFFWIINVEGLRGMSKNIGTSRRKKMIYPIAEKINELCQKGVIGMIVFDEAQMARNPDSQIGQALLSLQECKYRVPMSGTFVLNHPLDFFVPLKWCGIERHSFWDYKRHYCILGGFNGTQILGYKNLPHLRSIVSQCMIRHLKSEVLDLPPKVHSTEYVEMGREQTKLYNQVLEGIKENIDKIRLLPDPLVEMLRLRQVTGCPEVISTKVTQSAKLDRLKELVDDIVQSGQKVIVYSQWTTITEILKKELEQYNPAYITGQTKSDDRMNEVHKFQEEDKCKVIIGTIGAMGTGLTLTAASTVIFFDEPWNMSIKNQAEDRAYRVGTTSSVHIITLIANSTIDEAIHRLVQKKGKVADMLVDGKISSTNRENVIQYLLS